MFIRRRKVHVQRDTWVGSERALATPAWWFGRLHGAFLASLWPVILLGLALSLYQYISGSPHGCVDIS